MLQPAKSTVRERLCKTYVHVRSKMRFLDFLCSRGTLQNEVELSDKLALTKFGVPVLHTHAWEGPSIFPLFTIKGPLNTCAIVPVFCSLLSK